MNGRLRVDSKERPPITLSVKAEHRGLRLDRFLKDALPGISGGSLRRLLDQGKVLLDGAPAQKGDRLRPDQRVIVAVAAADERPLPQPSLALDVLDVTPALVAVNKPPGMATHPLLPGELDTVANALAARFPECVTASDNAREGGVVHRLDWGTSGVLLAARSAAVYRRLRAMFGAGKVIKRYLALVSGRLAERCEVTLPLRTRAGDRRRVSVPRQLDEGQPARSEVEPLAALAHDTTLVAVHCSTGRRHQVRVHLATLGHPIIGDELYGGPQLAAAPCDPQDGAFLHAASVELGDEHFGAPLPAARLALLRSLGYRPAVGLD
jgi:23S rRNA pseudouridine1911/1915/1917 synthase